MPLNHTIYGFPGIPWVGYLGVGYLGGTDGTLGPMGPWDRWDLGLKDPGPQGPPINDILRSRLIGPVKRKFRIPVPDPRLPGPSAGYPATGARCRISGYPGPVPDARLPGPAIFSKPKKSEKKIQKKSFF